ncbi:protein CIP2A [Megachile rotundata]|uniref:protein CIP2A n=1 Tax=Megachile rotundata TaxID=143995 RepID=UPI00061540BA|nr:PREDICTED: protein CIP2A isoform X1 [Megachile rotundata]XP_012138992.1 PREDICTED: protein CIP2A isoform X1 [Megachile rotundata]
MEKYQHMRTFISAVVEYTKHPSETTVSVLQRNLGVISASLDLSIFDPGTSIAAEFYVSLHELMNSLASRTTLIWSAVDVLQNACRNASARQALIHTYKFAPILARLLEANLTSEKRVRVLKLLQELTYGIKISWQEAHLPYLISILTQWVTQSKEEDIIALSLGVLVNLCYKNLPAVYTLMRTIDTKAFIRTLLKLQHCSVNTSVQCCKLLIILEHTNTNISEKYILDFAAVTFSSLVTAMKQKDVLLLRHIIDFFQDVGHNEHSHSVLLTYPHYGKDVENVLATLEDNEPDPECVTLMMEFLSSLVKLKLSALVPLYPSCVKTAMTWVPVEQVCSKALSLIRVTVIDARRTKTFSEVLAELDASVLMLIINSVNEEIQEKHELSSETEMRLAELMQLFQEMVKISTLRTKVMQFLNEQMIYKLLSPVMDTEVCVTGDWPGNFIQNPTTNLCIHALALTADLATNNSQWLTAYSELLRNKQIQMTMAHALFTGDGDIKQKVLQLTSTVGFPQECVSALALCMKQLEPLILIQSSPGMAPNIGNKISINSNTEMAPLFSFAQEERLDTFLAKLQRAYESNQISDITTSAVMELYEYKLAAMRHAERAMQSSLEAANNHGISLQHRLAQVVAESSRLHQMLFDSQQCLEGVKSTLTVKLAEVEEQSKKAVAVKKQEIEGLKKIVTEKSTNIDHLNILLVQHKHDLESSNNKIEVLTKKIKELEIECINSNAKITDMVNKNHEISKLLHKMQEQLNKKEQVIEQKTAEIQSNQKDISALKQETQQLLQLVHTYEQNIAEKEEALKKMSAELTDLSRMRDMIFELTAKKKEDLSTIN